jgi:Glycosyl transferase family 2
MTAPGSSWNQRTGRSQSGTSPTGVSSASLARVVADEQRARARTDRERRDAASMNAIVVVPARDEARRIGACIEALAAQTIGRDAFAVIVVLDDCSDDTRAVVDEVARRCRLNVSVIPGPGRGSGPARKLGMDLACERLFADGCGDGLIASTDADSRPAPIGSSASWLVSRVDPGRSRGGSSSIPWRRHGFRPRCYDAALARPVSGSLEC